MADLQSVEEQLAKESKAKANPLVSTLLDQLDQAVVYSLGGNVTTNKKLWDNYSQDWDTTNPWVAKMASNVGMSDNLEVLGDEWAPRAHTNEIIENFILPYSKGLRVAEIGVGGGRIARAVANLSLEFHAYDVSSRMLERTRHVLTSTACLQSQTKSVKISNNSVFRFDNQLETLVTFTLLTADNQSLGGIEKESYFDFIYSFDVLPHVDLHVLFQYLKEFHRTLKPGGKCFISTADITSEGGWARFMAQRGATVGGFCFTSPEAVLFLVEKAGFHVLHRAERRPDNVYLHRDLLLVLEKQT